MNLILKIKEENIFNGVICVYFYLKIVDSMKIDGLFGGENGRKFNEIHELK